MLERLAFAATLHQFAQRRQFRFSQLPLEFQIKLDPFPPEHMREQMLRIQSRIFDLVLLEIRQSSIAALRERSCVFRCHSERSLSRRSHRPRYLIELRLAENSKRFLYFGRHDRSMLLTRPLIPSTAPPHRRLAAR